MKIEKLAAIYVIILGLVTLAAAQFPSLMSDFVNVFSPVKSDLSSDWNVRYRMALFISATDDSVDFCSGYLESWFLWNRY